jgi:hypothetical protein
MSRCKIFILAILSAGLSAPAFAQATDPPETAPAPEQQPADQPHASPSAPAPAPTPAPAPAHAPASTPASSPSADDAPLQFKIGSASITPLGFMDFIAFWRNKAVGSGIGTNFGSIPYGNVFSNRIGETRFSMQNSRIGFRVDATVNDSHVIGYMESDFLGVLPGNVAVSTNSYTLRSRLYWVNLRKDEFELLAGQSWSLITPGRTGISPLPADIFFTQDIDVNYQAGLFWGRIPELRGVYHPSDAVAVALALDSPEQYVGGSAGGGLITPPASLMALLGTQLNNGNTMLAVPNLVPDLIGKVAFDPSPRLHIEAGGVMREFRVVNPGTGDKHMATGGGGFLNIGAEPLDGLRILTNNFGSAGGGRYIFGQAPDLILEADGGLSVVTTYSTVSGIEFTLDRTLLYGYYGGIYIAKNEAPAMVGGTCMNAATCIGYGYTGSPSGQNKWIQEETLGFNQTFWKEAKYGALNLMGQYSHLHRNPWSIAAGASKDAHVQMVFLNLRYTLPGAPPKPAK